MFYPIDSETWINMDRVLYVKCEGDGEPFRFHLDNGEVLEMRTDTRSDALIGPMGEYLNNGYNLHHYPTVTEPIR